jgi:hypothetical protein
MRQILLGVALLAGLQQQASSQQSAADLKKLQDYRDSLPQPGMKGELTADNLSVNAKGRPTFLDAKVMRIIDKNSMLVGLENSRTNAGRYSTWVLLKAPTAGIVDGKVWSGEGQWKEVMGSDVLKVTGTATIGIKTVFVLEPFAFKPKEHPADAKQWVQETEAALAEANANLAQAKSLAENIKKANRGSDAKVKQDVDRALVTVAAYEARVRQLEQTLAVSRENLAKFQQPGTLVDAPKKTGALAYEVFPVADRPKLVKDWEDELAALKRAIKDDEERLAQAATAKDKQHFQRLIAEYQAKLARHQKNDPPYVVKERANPAIAPPTGKTGAAVYDDFPEPLRSQLVKDWEGELEALKRAIKGDQERLARATSAKDKQHFERLIADYTVKLAIHEKNDPPYVTKDREQAVREFKGKK